MKILLKYSELPPGARMSLKDSILSHLKRLCTGPGHVITQLCVSLALLALQMEEWTDSIKEVIHSFTPNETTTNDQMRFGMLTCLLEFLTVLPEEAGNKRVLVLVCYFFLPLPLPSLIDANFLSE
jgi:transportin-3